MRKKKLFEHAVCLVLALGCVPAVGWAQERLLSKDQTKEVKKTEGWDFLLNTGLNFSLSDNSNTVAQPEGLSLTLGVNIIGAANFRSGIHELRNALNIAESYSRTPMIDDFIKSNDIFKEESIYLIHLLDWFGPYGALSLQSNMFESYDVRPTLTTWHITNVDGTSPPDRTGHRLRLTDGFQPFRLRETIGVFANPYTDSRLNFEIRLGVGGLHVFATRQWAIRDNAATKDIIEVAELTTYSEAGAELNIGLWGDLYDKKVTYRVNANFFMPFAYEIRKGQENGEINLTNIDLSALISFKLLEWLSIDYLFKAIREPQLLDKFQIQNMLVLTASYTFFKPPEPPKPEPVCNCPACTCPEVTCPPLPESAAPQVTPSE